MSAVTKNKAFNEQANEDGICHHAKQQASHSTKSSLYFSKKMNP